jgi:hypothetical protein
MRSLPSGRDFCFTHCILATQSACMKHLLSTFCLIAFACTSRAQMPIMNLDFNKTRSNWNKTRHVAPGMTSKLSNFSVPRNGNSYLIFRSNDGENVQQSLYAEQGTFSFLNTLALQTLAGGTYINGELTSVLFGPVRLGIGGSFKTTADTTRNEAVKKELQKIISTGGNLNMNFSLPLFFTRTSNDQLHFGVFALSNWAITPATLDTSGRVTVTSDNFSFNNQTGVNIHFDVCSNNNQKARLTFDVPMTYNWGNTLTDKLSLTDFSVVTVRAGFTIIDAMAIYVSGPLYSSSNAVQCVPFKLSVQLSPKKLGDMLN